eukprot:COSAG05_NODE_3139_length_2292_cov_1.995440_2_plen_124_part_00
MQMGGAGWPPAPALTPYPPGIEYCGADPALPHPRQVYGVVAKPISQDLHFELTTKDLAWIYTFFNIAYAIGMFFMGHIADRTNIRLFLGMCMIGAGVACMICGVLQLADCASLGGPRTLFHCP